MSPTFDTVYAETHRSVHALCVSLLGNKADADDVVQDTFINVNRALPGFRGESSVKTWVHRIAIRLAVRHRARRKPTAELDDNALPEGRTPADAHADADAVARSLDTLSYDHRIVVALFAVEGLTHAEIAETLGIPEGTVWSRLHKAKKQLAAMLG